MTGGPGGGFALAGGVLEVGRRADIAVIDPAGLDGALDEYHEAPLAEMGVNRVVRRNDRAVIATLIGGRVAFERGRFSDDFGKNRYGRFLRAGAENRGAVPIPIPLPLARMA